MTVAQPREDAEVSAVTATASASADASASDVVAPPPSKRVRRDYPWRDAYVRDLGVRPIQFDAATGDAVLVECSFCVHFGRETPPVLTKPVVKQDGQLLKTRARTRNVAHWKYPFRTDNMRSHHLQQHPHKWKTYQELLEQAKQEHIATKMQSAGEDASGGVVGEAEQRLAAFFGDAGDRSSNASAVSTPSSATSLFPTMTLPVTRVTRASSGTIAPHTHSAALTASAATGSLVVATISTPEIVDVVVAAMADVPEYVESSEAGPAPSFFVPQPDHGGANSAAPVQYAVMTPDSTALSRLMPMLRAGVSFSQIASVLQAAQLAQQLDRGDVAAYSRVLVASSLQRLSGLLNGAWAYSLHVHVAEPTRPQDPVAFRVSVRVPVNQNRSVDEFHVITLPVRTDVESLDDAIGFLSVVLTSLDDKWTAKVLSVALDRVTHYHAGYFEKQLISLLDDPKIMVFAGRQFIETRMQTAWTSFLGDIAPVSPFAAALLELIARLRSDGEWVRRHGHCPVIEIQSASSTFHALSWLLAHREAVPQTLVTTVAPSWWWLVASVIVEVWTSCLAAIQALSATATREQTTKALDNLRSVLKGKCCFPTLDDAEIQGSGQVKATYDEAERLATLTSAAKGGQLVTWTDKSMATCFRTLNVSARRLFDELTDASVLVVAERETSRFVLLTIGNVCCGLDNETAAAPHATQLPPTMPLDFSSFEPAKIVDLVEGHSRRLEAAFPTSFLDLVTREIRELQTTLAASSDAPLLQQLRSASASNSFADAWSLVAPYPAARTLAAGLATTLPQQRLASVRPFSRAESGELPRFALADLAVETHAHAQQAERLAKAADTNQAPTNTSAVVESQVI